MGGLGRSVKTEANLERAYCEILLDTDLGKRVRTTGKPRVAIGNLGYGAWQDPDDIHPYSNKNPIR